MKKIKKMVIFALVIGGVLALGCVAWADLLNKDVIVAGTESTYPPYQSRDPEGNLVGFDIDLMQLIADKLGKSVEWQDMAFDSLIPALVTKRIDAVIAGLSITEERAERVAFSKPYEISVSAFVVQAGSPIKDLADLDGKRVAVQIGTVQETFAHTIPGVTVLTFQKFTDCTQEVALGRVDAALMDIPVAREFVEHKEFAGKIEVGFNQILTEGGKAIAFHLDEKEFAAAVDNILDELEAGGQLDELRKKWNMEQDD
jgi:polar amino acid transport system substrate-binding protein